MRLYRFSPIESHAQLLAVMTYVHGACHELSLQTLGKYLPVAGNLGIFTHYEEEFIYLDSLRQQLTDERVHYNHKYFKLINPIKIDAKEGVPGATYEYLYIRKPDPYRSQVGDVDFVMDLSKHQTLWKTLSVGKFNNGARKFERIEENMIELWNPNKDVISYVVNDLMSSKVVST